LVETCGRNRTINGYDSADGHLASRERATRFGKRRSHELL
jgi:hypothetical protein